MTGDTLLLQRRVGDPVKMNPKNQARGEFFAWTKSLQVKFGPPKEMSHASTNE